MNRNGRAIDPAPPNASTLNAAFAAEGIRVLVLRGGATTLAAGMPAERSIQLLIAPEQARAAIRVAEGLAWRYSWVRDGLLRLIPTSYYWWDGGVDLHLHWACPAAPLPSRTLGSLTRALWVDAAPDDEGLLRPNPATLLVHNAVQACRPARGHEPDWQSFLELREAIPNLRPAHEIARRAGVSAALSRALDAADAGRGMPGPGPLFEGVLGPAWWLAAALQARAPRRLGRLLAGMPSLGDAAMRCRVGGVESIAGPGVFVPTPDLEIFIEMAIERLSGTPRPVVLELGTGCGAIALALAAARPDAEVHATDLSAAAIKWARVSAGRVGLERVQFHTGPLLEPVPEEMRDRVDIIVANLPFYPERDFASIGSVPRDTIQGEGDDGLGLLRQLARDAPRFLRPGGALVLQMFEWQWSVLAAELTALGYRTGSPRITDPFAIAPAERL
jgi:release factor glutamine methyltransferase